RFLCGMPLPSPSAVGQRKNGRIEPSARSALPRSPRRLRVVAARRTVLIGLFVDARTRRIVDAPVGCRRRVPARSEVLRARVAEPRGWALSACAGGGARGTGTLLGHADTGRGAALPDGHGLRDRSGQPPLLLPSTRRRLPRSRPLPDQADQRVLHGGISAG